MNPSRFGIHIENAICYQWNFVWCVMIIGSVSSKIDWKYQFLLVFSLFYSLIFFYQRGLRIQQGRGYDQLYIHYTRMNVFYHIAFIGKNLNNSEFLFMSYISIYGFKEYSSKGLCYILILGCRPQICTLITCVLSFLL